MSHETRVEKTFFTNLFCNIQGSAKVVGQYVQLIVQLMLIQAQIFFSQNIPRLLV